MGTPVGNSLAEQRFGYSPPGFQARISAHGLSLVGLLQKAEPSCSSSVIPGGRFQKNRPHVPGKLTSDDCEALPSHMAEKFNCYSTRSCGSTQATLILPDSRAQPGPIRAPLLREWAGRVPVRYLLSPPGFSCPGWGSSNSRNARFPGSWARETANIPAVCTLPGIPGSGSIQTRCRRSPPRMSRDRPRAQTRT